MQDEMPEGGTSPEVVCELYEHSLELHLLKGKKASSVHIALMTYSWHNLPGSSDLMKLLEALGFTLTKRNILLSSRSLVTLGRPHLARL
jgi:hypothetical protein